MSKKKLPRYPWEVWLGKKAGQKTYLVKGKHFGCQIHSMQVLIRGAAAKRGIPVSLHTANDKIVITIKRKGR